MYGCIFAAVQVAFQEVVGNRSAFRDLVAGGIESTYRPHRAVNIVKWDVILQFAELEESDVNFASQQAELYDIFAD